MEISAVRQQVLQAIERAKRAAAERRAANAEAGREYGAFLEQIAMPLFRQVGTTLRAEGYAFTLFTPTGSVRLMSDKSTADFIEIVLDTSDGLPAILGRTSRAWGNRTNVSERPLNASARIRDLTEADVLEFLLKAIEPFVER
jgi:hypothetical protein